ncbi:hypothetical protein RIF29_33263 [Crotalaria pallida]|uniref:SWIM-type domain-containing protein n=1 Tax=Crotalaria pallida TaxID=3830 RepID=A0AAN9EDH3_CROPI
METHVCENVAFPDVEEEVVISESDDEWRIGDEPQQDEGGETDSDYSYTDEEENHDVNSNDEPSDYEEKHDIITTENSDEDKVPIYIDRGMKGKPFVSEPDENVKLEVGLLFVNVNEFRAVLKDFVIQEGFEIERIKNEKTRVNARCAADGCCWRIHASPAPDGITFKIKMYTSVHTCIRTSKNSNATSTWIATKLESKLRADPNMSYKSMKQELLDKFGVEPSNVTQLYRARKRAYNEFMFNKAMEKVGKVSIEAANWLLDPERPKSMWARHTIDPECKSDHVTNNISEAFNSWVGDDRSKTILSMVESLTCRLMKRFQRRYEKGCSFENIITPRIRNVLDTTMQDGRMCRVTYAGDDEFQVIDGYTTFVVNLRARTCGCNYWVLSGLPCKHACACIAYKRANVDSYCDGAYTTRSYCKSYIELIHPMPELDPNNRGNYGQIDPPALRRLPGRPRRNRKRSLVEGPSGTQDARRSSTVRCGNCREFGHNSLGCQRDKTKKQVRKQLKLVVKKFLQINAFMSLLFLQKKLSDLQEDQPTGATQVMSSSNLGTSSKAEPTKNGAK